MLPDTRPSLPAYAAVVVALLLTLTGLGEAAQAAPPGPSSEAKAASSAQSAHSAPSAQAQRGIATRNIARDGGFETATGWRHTPRANFAVYRSGQVSRSSVPRSGARYGATNTRARGGSIYQDSAVRTVPGQVLCATAWVRTQAGATGAAGTFAVWLLGGGGRDENGSVDFKRLGNRWGQVRACAQATTTHSVLRIQLYPKVNGPTVDIDDIDVHGSLARDGGFEGPTAWQRFPGTNFVSYRSGQVSRRSTAVDGARYGATNASATGGSIYTDRRVTTSPGDVLCASAYVRTQAGATGAAGTLAVWLLGGRANENGSVGFSRLGNGWGRIQTCVQATSSHTVLRVQLYPRVGGPTVDIDNIDVHASRARDGGFEGPNSWSTLGSTNYVEYRTGVNTTSRGRSGRGYGATNTTSVGGSIYQDQPVSATAGQIYCASAFVRTQRGETRAAGTFAVWLTGGAYNENGTANFANLGNGWGQVQTCVEATTAHNTLRIQLYPKAGGPTVDIDDVDVH